MNRTWLQRRRRAIVTLVILVIVLGSAGWAGFRARESARQQAVWQAEYEAEEQILQRLEQPVRIHFGRVVTLREWLAEFTGQTGVRVQAELQFAIAGGPDPFSGANETQPVQLHDQMIELDLPTLPAHQALERLAMELHTYASWSVDDDGRVIVRERIINDKKPGFSDETRALRKYSVPLHGFHSPVEWLEILGAYEDPDAQSRYATSFQALPDGFVLLQSRREHLRTRQFLRQLELASRRARDRSSTEPVELIQTTVLGGETVVAWPIADLIEGSHPQQQAAELFQTVAIMSSERRDSSLDLTYWRKFRMTDGGGLLLSWNAADKQAEIGRILAALRQVYGGHTRQASTVNPANLEPDELQQRLDKPLAFEFRGATAFEWRAELKTRGGIDFPDTRRALDWKPVLWAHLPAQSLGDQVALLVEDVDYLRAHNFRITLPDGLDTGAGRELQVEIMDARPWFTSPLAQHDLIALLHKVDDPREAEPALVAQVFRGLAAVRCRPTYQQPARDLVTRLVEYHEPHQPRRWNGQPLTGEALSRPLELFTPSERTQRQAARAAEIERKLAQRVSLEILRQKRGEALLLVARQFDLPLVHHERTPDLDPEQLVELPARDLTLATVLQDLIGGADSRWHWIWDRGFLEIVERSREPTHRNGWLYSVDDLVLPRGKLQPGQLVRTLTLETPTSRKPPYDHPSFQPFRVTLHFGSLLHCQGPPRVRERLEEVLRQLRSGELQPQPASAGDEELFDLEPFGGFFRLRSSTPLSLTISGVRATATKLEGR